MECAFTEFYTQFSVISEGRGGSRQLKERCLSEIVVVTPDLPRTLWKPHAAVAERAQYARTMLRKHFVYADMDAYKAHAGLDDEGVIRAYIAFGESPAAPERCRADSLLVAADELPVDFGEHLEEVHELAEPEAHGDCIMYWTDFASEQVQCDTQYDWAKHTTERYTREQICDAPSWLRNNAREVAELPPAEGHVSADALNPGQRLVYDAVQSHDDRRRHPRAYDANPPRRIDHAEEPLRAIVSGTAGSGKSFLIAALFALLGDRCLVLAPTGVAADNVGGETCHSALRLPSTDGEDDKLPTLHSDDKKLLQERFRNVTHVIFDELSMIGARMFALIDHVLRVAKNNPAEWFGGLSIILVGDHGQLPPVKDKPLYSTRVGKKKESARKRLQNKGREAYALFKDVFFLDQVMRAAGADERHATFRARMLRARAAWSGDDDAPLMQSDSTWMKSRELRALAESDPAAHDRFVNDEETYYLTATKDRRDLRNAEMLLKMQRDHNRPVIEVLATHTDEHDAKRPPDDFNGLLASLKICVGARVMIVANLKKALGLVNGTVGKVFDIMCDHDGHAVCVLVLLRRAAKEGAPGYKGPSFLSRDAMQERGLDPDKVAVVAIGKHTVGLRRGTKQQRTQFPLVLAWAVTVHKSQGLTLARVLIDLGEAELRAAAKDDAELSRKLKGLTAELLFVAMSRVKDPLDVAFVQAPTLDLLRRLKKRHEFIARQAHLRHLRVLAETTRERYCRRSTSGAAPAVEPVRIEPASTCVQGMDVDHVSVWSSDPCSSDDSSESAGSDASSDAGRSTTPRPPSISSTAVSTASRPTSSGPSARPRAKESRQSSAAARPLVTILVHGGWRGCVCGRACAAP